MGRIAVFLAATAAVYQATVPMMLVVMRRCFGVGGAGMTNMHGLHHRYAWPSGRWGSLPLEGGIQAAFRNEIRQAEDPDAYYRDMLQKLGGLQSPFRTAEHFGIEEIIDPRDTRPLLCEWAEHAYKLLPQLLGPSMHGMRP